MPRIRHETAQEQGAVRALIETSFRGVPHADGREQLLVDALRESGDLALSLVAELDGQLVGHIAFSPVLIDGQAATWFGLAPLAVLPAHRRQGVGSSLVETGLVALRSAGAQGCVVLGDPAYYARFGFAAHAGLTLEGVPAELFMGCALADGSLPRGAVKYSPAFSLFE